MTPSPFWKTKALTEMTQDEWESLCDSCGKCCLLKLEDADSGVIHYTDVSCRLLDTESCRCSRYSNRKALVSDCVVLTPDMLDKLPWMPESCSYRLLHEGKDLPDWHPLVTGEADSTITSGHSVKGKIISETRVEENDLPSHIKDWSTKP